MSSLILRFSSHFSLPTKRTNYDSFCFPSYNSVFYLLNLFLLFTDAGYPSFPIRSVLTHANYPSFPLRDILKHKVVQDCPCLNYPNKLLIFFLAQNILKSVFFSNFLLSNVLLWNRLVVPYFLTYHISYSLIF